MQPICIYFRASGPVRRHCPLPFLLLPLSLVSSHVCSVVLSRSLCSPYSPAPQAKAHIFQPLPCIFSLLPLHCRCTTPSNPMRFPWMPPSFPLHFPSCPIISSSWPNVLFPLFISASFPTHVPFISLRCLLGPCSPLHFPFMSASFPFPVRCISNHFPTPVFFRKKSKQKNTGLPTCSQTCCQRHRVFPDKRKPKTRTSKEPAGGEPGTPVLKTTFSGTSSNYRAARA